LTLAGQEGGGAGVEDEGRGGRIGGEGEYGGGGSKNERERDQRGGGGSEGR